MGNRDTKDNAAHGHGLAQPLRGTVSGYLSLFRCRLCWRITIVVFLSILIVEALILVPSYFKKQQELLDGLASSGHTGLTSALYWRGHGPGFSVDEYAFNAQAFDLLWPLVGFRLYSPDGTVLGTFGEAPLHDYEAARAGTGVLTSSDDGTRYEVFSIVGKSPTSFNAVIRLDNSHVATELHGFVWRIAGLVVLIALFVCGATMAALALTVLKPVLDLRTMMLLAKENPETADQFASRSRGWDELGDITDAYDDLVRRLTGRYRSNLREREQRFEDFAQAASDWFWEMDENLRFSYFSERFTQVTGVPSEKLLGKTREETGIPGVDPEFWQQHLDDLSAHRAFRGFTHPRTKSDGSEVWLSISGKPTFDLDGNFKGYRGIGQDVTYFKQFEEDLRLSKNKAEQANRAKSAFLANMSHELRTPLNAVIGYSEIIETEMFGAVGDPKYLDYAKDIHASGRHLLALINDILDLSKIESGTSELEREPIAIGLLLLDVEVLVQPHIQKAEVELSVRVPDGLPDIRADRRKLVQILTNILTNAIKFTMSGGTVSLEVACDPGAGHVITVIDTGIGMSPEEIPIALAPFQQVDSGLDRKYEGTGLGLPLSMALMELHGGTLELLSERGVGTTVILRFPADCVVPDAHGEIAMTARDGQAG